MDKKFGIVGTLLFLAGIGVGEVDLQNANAAIAVNTVDSETSVQAPSFNFVVKDELTSIQSINIANVLVNSLGAEIEKLFGYPAGTMKPKHFCNEKYFPARAISLSCNDDGSAFIARINAKIAGSYVAENIE